MPAPGVPALVHADGLPAWHEPYAFTYSAYRIHYGDRASCLQLECDVYSCPELGKTAHFEGARPDDEYGPVRFEPGRLRGLGLRHAAPELLRGVLMENAARLLSGA